MKNARTPGYYYDTVKYCATRVFELTKKTPYTGSLDRRILKENPMIEVSVAYFVARYFKHIGLVMNIGVNDAKPVYKYDTNRTEPNDLLIRDICDKLIKYKKTNDFNGLFAGDKRVDNAAMKNQNLDRTQNINKDDKKEKQKEMNTQKKVVTKTLDDAVNEFTIAWKSATKEQITKFCLWMMDAIVCCGLTSSEIVKQLISIRDGKTENSSPLGDRKNPRVQRIIDSLFYEFPSILDSVSDTHLIDLLIQRGYNGSISKKIEYKL